MGCGISVMMEAVDVLNGLGVLDHLCVANGLQILRHRHASIANLTQEEGQSGPGDRPHHHIPSSRLGLHIAIRQRNDDGLSEPMGYRRDNATEALLRHGREHYYHIPDAEEFIPD